MTQPVTSTSSSTGQPRTSVLPPPPGRHHWCVLVPSSTDLHFDAVDSRADHNRLLVEALWARGIGCARFDLVARAATVHPAHPAAFGRQIHRTADVLERLRRMDPRAEITLVGGGDGIDTAFALARLDETRDPDEPSPWPVFRSLLLLAPVVAGDEATLARKVRDLAGIVARDEHLRDDRRAGGVTRRVLRRLGW